MEKLIVGKQIFVNVLKLKNYVKNIMKDFNINNNEEVERILNIFHGNSIESSKINTSYYQKNANSTATYTTNTATVNEGTATVNEGADNATATVNEAVDIAAASASTPMLL